MDIVKRYLAVITFLILAIFIQGCTSKKIGTEKKESSDKSQVQEINEYTLTPNSDVKNAEHKLGELEVYDTFQMTCLDYKFCDYCGKSAEKGYAYLIIDFEIKNDGKETAYIRDLNGDIYNFSVYYKEDYRYDSFYEDSSAYLQSHEAVPALGTTSGILAYLVPIEVRDKKESLKLRVSRNLDGDTSYIDWVLRNEGESLVEEAETTEAVNVFQIVGNGEVALGQKFYEILSNSNIAVKSINLVMEELNLNDCDVLLICGLRDDLSEETTQTINEYLSNGGSALIYVDYSDYELPNLKSILDEYGIGTVDGIVLEQDSNFTYQNIPGYVIPNINKSVITNGLDDKDIVCVQPIGIETFSSSVSTSITFTPILTTSEEAFSKMDLIDASYAMSENDISGPFVLGLLAENKQTDNKVLVYGTSNLIMDDVFDEHAGFGNAELLISSIEYLAGR